MLRLILYFAIAGLTSQGIPFTGCLEIQPGTYVGDCPISEPVALEWDHAQRKEPRPTKP